MNTPDRFRGKNYMFELPNIIFANSNNLKGYYTDLNDYLTRVN